MQKTVSFRLNGKPVQIQVDSERSLLWVLRTDLALTGTKYGCGISECGACTVLINDHAVRSCTTGIGAVEGKEVTTIEGLAKELKQRGWNAEHIHSWDDFDRLRKVPANLPATLSSLQLGGMFVIIRQ